MIPTVADSQVKSLTDASHSPETKRNAASVGADYISGDFSTSVLVTSGHLLSGNKRESPASLGFPQCDCDAEGTAVQARRI
jgi:hypothetical protein